MRILFITHFFPPGRNAGTENYTLGLAKAFTKRGHEVQVLCAEDWESGDSYWNGVSNEYYDGIPVHRIHLNWSKADNPNKVLYDSLPVEKWLDQFLGEQKFDLVHVTSTMTLGIGVLRSVNRAGIALILTLMDFWFICPSVQLLRSDGNLCDGDTSAWECLSCLLENSNWYRSFKKLPVPEAIQSKPLEWLSRVNMISKQRGLRGMLLNMAERKEELIAALSLPDRILAHSKIVQQLFGRNVSVRVDLLRNGQSLPWQGQFPPKASSSLLRFGYIGQIEKIKGVHVLIEAFQKASIDQHAHLDIWGDLTRNPSYVTELKALSDHNSSINFLGRFDRVQLASVLAGIDVLVVPSIWYENAPLVIQEAFAAGVPVIASNLGGMAEAVTHEVNGLLFERGDSTDLARQIKRIADEPALLSQLKAGIPSIKPIEDEAEQLEQIYFELISRINNAEMEKFS
jgi:glycosyltransferase involved in cell wall biosynthesis